MIKPALYSIISQVSHFSSTSESLSRYFKLLLYRIQTCFFLSLWELVLLLSSRFIARLLSSAQLFLTLFSNSWLLIPTFLLPTTACSLNSIVLALSAYLFCDNVFFFWSRNLTQTWIILKMKTMTSGKGLRLAQVSLTLHHDASLCSSFPISQVCPPTCISQDIVVGHTSTG